MERFCIQEKSLAEREHKAPQKSLSAWYAGTLMALPISAIRAQFPILNRTEKLIYLDTAASAQKPEVVLRAMDTFSRSGYGNVHRGMHPLAERATDAYEGARNAVRRFIGAAHADEIIFQKNCTEAINLVAKSWARKNLKRGDTVALSLLEHHSNIVPWLQLKEEIGISVAWIDIDDEGNVKMKELDSILAGGNVRLVSVTGQSNVLGTRPPLREIIVKAHAAGALVCIDAAQLAGHHPIDVQKLDCDFLTFTGHKPYGPTGIGVLYARRALLREMPPFLGGGMMIREVKRDGFSAADSPQKFEAGTPPIVEAVGLHAAIDWLTQYPWKDIEEHEAHLLKVAAETLATVPGLRILGHFGTILDFQNNESTNQRINESSGCLSFIINNIHPHDLTALLGQEGFCLRAGHHCTQPLHERLGIPASTRLSVGIYNTEEEIRSIGPAIARAIKRLTA